MSQRAVDFVHMWISATVHPNDVIDERRDAEPKLLNVGRMLAWLVFRPPRSKRVTAI